MATIIQRDDFVQFNTEEAFTLSVKPAVRHNNPFAQGGNLFKTVNGMNKYKMLHLALPEDVLIPQAACDVWSPSAKSFVVDDSIECNYYEVNESMCPDEYLARCLHNISSKGKAIGDIMIQAGSPISEITAALVLGLRDAIASSMYKIGFFADTTFGTSDYYRDDIANYMHKRSKKGRDRLVSMMSQMEGIDTILRRRTANGEVAYVDTNDGTAEGNCTLPTNIKDFLVQMRLSSHDALQYYDQVSGGNGGAAYYLQGGLYRAYIDYLESLTGGKDQHRFIVDGTPVPGVYDFEGFPVIHWVDADIFDTSIGLKSPTTGHSLNQRAMFVAPQVPTLLTNLKSAAGFEGSGLILQQSPLVKDKGRMDMFMTLGIGAGIAHNELITYGYNSSVTYATS